MGIKIAGKQEIQERKMQALTKEAGIQERKGAPLLPHITDGQITRILPNFLGSCPTCIPYTL